MSFPKRVAVLTLLISNLAFATPTSAKDITALSQDKGELGLKLNDQKSRTMSIIRDGGIGLGIGAASGLIFILTSQGSIPSRNPSFDGNALTTTSIVGLIGGLAHGFWAVKHPEAEPDFAVDLTPKMLTATSRF